MPPWSYPEVCSSPSYWSCPECKFLRCPRWPCSPYRGRQPASPALPPSADRHVPHHDPRSLWSSLHQCILKNEQEQTSLQINTQNIFRVHSRSGVTVFSTKFTSNFISFLQKLQCNAVQCNTKQSIDRSKLFPTALQQKYLTRLAIAFDDGHSQSHP